MSRKILIAGCGQLGSRHLQSFANANYALSIDLLDPFYQSLKKAEHILNEAAKHSHKIQLYTQIDQLVEQKYDFIVVATNSDVRLKLIQDLKMKGIKSEGWLLEKVLCQSATDCEILLKELPEQAWVNCPRRIYPSYNKIKKSLNSNEAISVTYSGANWGLACNAIHFIDLVSFLTNEMPVLVETKELIPQIVASKRSGFIEFNGKVNVYFQNKSQLFLNCHGDTTLPTSVKITQAGTEFEVFESLNTLKITKKDSQSEDLSKTPLQSGLTLSVFEHFISNGCTGLTPLKESVALHAPFLNALTAFYNQVRNENVSKIPIT